MTTTESGREGGRERGDLPGPERGGLPGLACEVPAERAARLPRSAMIEALLRRVESNWGESGRDGNAPLTPPGWHSAV
ncbi:hypothetical protein ABZX85_31795 [Streptomyces sp. NPDC004539]|uniref:hypothetical protein n=1 Tax=Streptomyces sp. NPDC004539 TaxID=3154280 RepID=UPI0033A17A90